MSEAILEAIQENNTKLDRLIAMMMSKNTKPSDWVDPDQAAKILGFPIVKSKSHRRRVRWLADKGFLVKFRAGKPFMYWREELEAVSKKIASGEIVPAGRV